MRSTDVKAKSEFNPLSAELDCHFLPAREFLRETLQISLWKMQHGPEVSSLQLFRELIAYEQPVGQAVRALPMILRLSQGELNPVQIRGMEKALESWKGARPFYTEVFFDIEAAVKSKCNSEKAAPSDIYSAYCEVVFSFGRQVRESHSHLGCTIAGLYESGFTLSAIRPRMDRTQLRLSA